MLGDKRKRVVVSLDKKLEALERLEKGESVKKIALDFGVGETTVKDWKKNKTNIKTYCSSVSSETPSALTSRCTLKKPNLEILDNALWLWFVQQRHKGVPLSGPKIQKKALHLNWSLNGDVNFSASDGWLTKWKKRHGVHVLPICGEKLWADPSVAADFSNQLIKIITDENMVADQIYNIDEMALNYRMLPRQASAPKTELNTLSKDKITVAVCSNASGSHKLPLFVVGKSVNPGVFKNINLSFLPVYYRTQNSAWMDSFLFQEWFDIEFIPKVKTFLKSKNLSEKVILILDNDPSHLSSDFLKYDEIKVMFLPPNVTSLIQPMNQGVIVSMKRLYKKKLLTSILESNNDCDIDVTRALQKINIKDVIYTITDVWKSISETTLQKSWLKIWLADFTNDITPSLEEDELLQLVRHIPGCEDAEEQDVIEWLNEDENVEKEMDDDEIIAAVMNNTENNESDNESDDDQERKIPHAKGKEVLEVALRYVEQQLTSTPVDVLNLKKWRDYAADKCKSNTKFKKLQTF